MNRDIKYYVLFIMILIVGIIGIIIITDDIMRAIIGTGSIFGSAIFFLRIIVNLPTYQKFTSPILSTLGYFWNRAELESIACNIQGNLNQYGQKINEETPDLIPETKLEWVRHEEKETFYKEYDGKLIIRLKPSKNNSENLTKTTMVQVAKGVLAESRIYVEDHINTSIDLTLAKKILIEQDRNSYLYFQNEILIPKLTDQDIIEYLKSMEISDNNGLFTRLYLRELKQLPKRHGLKLTHINEIRQDTTDFLNFSNSIARKERGIDVPTLDYQGDYIHTGIVMVAKPIVFQKLGVRPYVNRIIEKFDKGAEIIYIIAWKDTLRYAQRVISYLIRNHDIDPIRDSTQWYLVNNESRMCVPLQKRDTSISQKEN